MTLDKSTRIPTRQRFQKLPQGQHLCRGEIVFWFGFSINTTHQTDADGVAVEALNMRPGLVFWPPFFNDTRAPNDIVITNTRKLVSPMPFIDIRNTNIHAWRRSGTMDGDVTHIQHEA